MARGYLGKISAIVTANTGDYVRKLNESASETRNFAKTVESTLRSASRDAARSLQNIYTPLQQFERALRAAASQRLSFKGFDGAINTVEQLKQRLSTIRDADINVVVKASGLNTITDLKLAIKDISQTDIDLFRNVGGLPGLQKLRADIEATRDAAGNLTVKPRVDIAEIDRLIERFSVIDDRTIQVVMDVLGQRELDATVAKLRQLRDVTDALQKPLATAVARFGELPQSLQGAFIPALAKTQAAVEQVTSDIEANVPVSRERFEQLASAVALTTKSVDELRVASAALSKIRTGRELEFQQPAAVAALTRAGSVDPTPVLTQSNSKQFSEAQAAIRREADELANLIAVRKRAEEEEASTGTLSVIQAQIDTKVAALNRQVNAYQQVADAAKRAAAEEAGSGDATALIARAKAQQEFYAESERLQKQAATDAAAPLIARAKAEQEFYAESKRLQEQAAQDEAAVLIARARAQQDFYAESERLQKQAAADSAAPLIARARAEQDYYAESERLQKQAAADSAAPLIARARAEQDYYAESQRLQKQAASDAAAPLIARARAEQDFYAESERLQKQAAQDEAAILIARARAQQEFEAERERLQKQAAEDLATPLIRRAQADRSTAIDFGLDLDAPKRQVEVLRGSIVSLKGQLDGIPVSFRAGFVTAILEAERNLERLAAAPGATIDQLIRAEAEVNRLAAAAGRASKAFNFRDRFGGGATDIFQDQALRGYAAQLEILQRALGRASAEARGPGVAAFARLRDFIANAARTGTLEFEATQRTIRELTREAVNATSAVAGIGRGGLGRQLQRAGDVGRAGFDRFGLGVQQAAFAIDDFFSVTGGFEQRLRAVGNNLTQLGFIVGGTAGLFTALAFTAGSQIVLALAKFIRGGAEAKEIAAGLNDRLSEQATLLRDISSGFGDIGDGIAESAFSQATERAEAFEKRLTAVIDKLKELRDNVASALDPELTVASGRLGTFEKNLKEADSVPLASARQARVLDAQNQVREARNRATSRGPISRQELQEAISEGFGGAPFAIPQGTNSREIQTILERQRYQLAQVVDSWVSTFTEPFNQSEARRRILIVQDALSRLTADISQNIGNITQGAFRDSARSFEGSSRRSSSLLDRAQRAGGENESTRLLQSNIERDANRFRAVVKQFSQAVSAGRQDEAEKASRLLATLAESASLREREAKALLDAANAASRFTDVLKQFRELNDSILGDVGNAAAQARRDAVQSAGTSSAGLSRRDDSEFAQRRSDRLQRELRDAESRRRDIESSILEAERRFRQESPDPNVRRLVTESERARSIAEDPTRSDRARADARQRQLEADQRLQRGFQASPLGQSLQSQLDDADRRAQVSLSRDSLITRGRELSRTDGQRAGRELGESLRAINAEFDDRVNELQRADPFADLASAEADRRAALEKVTQDSLRAAAPAVFALQDAVQNAILQGPSRAALNAADVTTMEGSRELNRLLRGDDPARDVSLLELQKQTKIMEEQLRVAKEGPPVAN